MQFNTVEDIIQFAIRKEEAACQFYHDLAGLMKDQATQIMFEVLGRNELQHKENLKLELMKLGQLVEDDNFTVSDSDESYIELDHTAMNMSYRDALQLAIRKEKAAFRLFTELMVQTHDPQLRKVFFDLAQEEMRHVIQFEREYNEVITKK